MYKILLLFLAWVILYCDLSLDNTSGQPSPVIQKPDNEILKCTYNYFVNDKHELDSSIVECPDPVPTFIPRIKPLNIDTMRTWHRG
jgi:hypothetical protein